MHKTWLSPTDVGSMPMWGAGTARLRLLHVTARYAPLVGGTEIHTQEVATRLAAMGHAVTVLTTDSTGDLPRREERAGVTVIRVPAYPARRDYYFAPALAGVIGRAEWDVVHVQGYHNLVAPLAMLAAWQARIPYVVTFHSGGHSSRLRQGVRGVQARALRPLLARAERLIGVSRFEVEMFRRRLGLPIDQFEVIPNGAALPAPTRQAAQDGSPLIVSVGRLERYKGHDRVIRALPRVVNDAPTVRLRIIGTGPYEPQLRELAARCGVAERVEIGSASRQEMADLLAQADVVTVLSEYESQGIAALEAVSLGRPVLVTDATALHDLVEDGLAAPAPLDADDPTIAAAIVGQLRQPLRPAVTRVPSWDACAASLDRLYTAVVAEPQGQGRERW